MASAVFVKDIAVTDGWEMQVVRVEPGARFPVHTHESSEFLFILEGDLVRSGRRMGPGWASVASAGTIDEDVHSETGCVFGPRRPCVILASSPWHDGQAARQDARADRLRRPAQRLSLGLRERRRFLEWALT